MNSDDGASAVEYALLLAAVALVLVVVVYALGTATRGLFEDSCEHVATSAKAECVTGPTP